jgi:hypothetical protein
MAHRTFGSAAPVLIHPTGGGLCGSAWRLSREIFRGDSGRGPAELIAEGEIS